MAALGWIPQPEQILPTVPGRWRRRARGRDQGRTPSTPALPEGATYRRPGPGSQEPRKPGESMLRNPPCSTSLAVGVAGTWTCACVSGPHGARACSRCRRARFCASPFPCIHRHVCPCPDAPRAMPRAKLNMVMAVTLVSRKVSVSFSTWCQAPLLSCTLSMAAAWLFSSCTSWSRSSWCGETLSTASRTWGGGGDAGRMTQTVTRAPTRRQHRAAQNQPRRGPS